MLEISGLTWALTIGLILVLLAIDLVLAAMRPHRVGFGEAAAWSVFYVLVAIGFGLLLLYTAVQLFRHRNEDPDVENNVIVRGARRVLPVTDEYVEGRLFTRIDGRSMVTPLFVVLVAIGGVDLLFALDSIPAVFGVTEEAFIVFAANAFALLGLRALFFLVKGLLDRLVYLSAGLAVILAFIGVKLILHWAHVDIDKRVPEVPTPLSLGVIAGILVIVVVASLVKTSRDPSAKAHSGSLRASTSGAKTDTTG